VSTTEDNLQMASALLLWRRALARHHPGRLFTAMTVALGANRLAEVSSLRAGIEAYNPVGSDTTRSRPLTVLAGDVDAAKGPIGAAR
ncbi:hypothetical protein ACT3SQ_18695, partial [Brachybacterium sp. AOP42-C2-15]